MPKQTLSGIIVTRDAEHLSETVKPTVMDGRVRLLGLPSGSWRALVGLDREDAETLQATGAS